MARDIEREDRYAPKTHELQPDQVGYGTVAEELAYHEGEQYAIKRYEECKPDQSSRLLTGDEIKDAKVGHVAILVHGKPEVRDSDWEVAKAQLAKDEARIEALISKILGKMNKRDVGGEKPEWGLSDKDYQELKANPTSEVEG